MFRNLERDNDPQLLLYDIDNEIAGSMLFPLNRFSIESMERFSRNILEFLSALVRNPEQHVKDIVLSP